MENGNLFLMISMKNNKKGYTSIEILIGVTIVGLIALAVIIPVTAGIGGFGPTNIVEATVTRLYVDAAGEQGSHYMVATNQGVFEVDNGLLLWIWNADEIYGALQTGKTYRFTTKGNKVVNFMFQEYPYIVKAQEITN